MNWFERHCHYYFEGCDFDCRVREKEKHLEIQILQARNSTRSFSNIYIANK